LPSFITPAPTYFSLAFLAQLKITDVFVARSGSGQPVYFKIELTGDSDFDWTLFCGTIRRTLHLPIDFRLEGPISRISVSAEKFLDKILIIDLAINRRQKTQTKTYLIKIN
jgi:hypothetical protein